MQASSNMATFVPTRESDIRAFAWMSPLDKRPEVRAVIDLGDVGTVVKTHETRETYIFHEPTIGTVVFDVRGIKDAMVNGELEFQMLRVVLDRDWVEHVRKNGGVEPDRMARLTTADLVRPGIGVLWGNGYTTVIDGNHRLVRRYDDGNRRFRMAMLVIGPGLRRFVCRPGQEERFLDMRRRAT